MNNTIFMNTTNKDIWGEEYAPYVWCQNNNNNNNNNIWTSQLWNINSENNTTQNNQDYNEQIEYLNREIKIMYSESF